MKKYINNPIIMICVSIGFFCIALINSIINNASNWSELTWWGNISISIFILILLTLLIKNMFIPIGKYIINIFKK